MVQQHRYGAVVLISCRAVAGGPSDDEPARAVRPNNSQAWERNVLLGRAELEFCPRSLRIMPALAAPDVNAGVA